MYNNQGQLMKTANVIINQLGNRALMMLGAKNLMGLKDDAGLTFKIGRNSKKVTHIRITLTSMDLYDVEYIYVRGTTIKTTNESNSIYNDMLLNDIEVNTGLYTSLNF